MKMDEKTMKCRCECELFRIVYTPNQIEAYCSNCSKLCFITNSYKQQQEKPIDQPNVEDCQSQLIDLMKSFYDLKNKDDVKYMKEFVNINLRTAKVQDCKDIDMLHKAYELLYNMATNI
jgi:hypothetical protein